MMVRVVTGETAMTVRHLYQLHKILRSVEDLSVSWFFCHDPWGPCTSLSFLSFERRLSRIGRSPIGEVIFLDRELEARQFG